MNIFSLHHNALGLDFSDLCLRVAMLKKKGRFLDLVSWKETKIKPGIITQGIIKDEDRLSYIIKNTIANVNGEKISSKYAVVSLPEKKAFLQVIQIPKMDEDELKTAIYFEAENYIPLPIGDVYLDFEVLPFTSKSDRFDVLIAAIPKPIANSYISCLKKADLIPKVLEIESQSIVRALIKKHVSPFPVLVIDLGRSTTSFIVFSGYSLRFTSSILFSSQNLTMAISKNLNISPEDAEKLKLKYGLEVDKKSVKNKQIIEAITPLLVGLTKQAKKYINYYHTHANHVSLSSGGGKIKKVLLCGRGVNLKGLPDFISSELGIPAEYANPWVNIMPKSSKKVPKLPFKDSLGYTTALGLALRGLE